MPWQLRRRAETLPCRFSRCGRYVAVPRGGRHVIRDVNSGGEVGEYCGSLLDDDDDWLYDPPTGVLVAWGWIYVAADLGGGRQVTVRSSEILPGESGAIMGVHWADVRRLHVVLELEGILAFVEVTGLLLPGATPGFRLLSRTPVSGIWFGYAALALRDGACLVSTRDGAFSCVLPGGGTRFVVRPAGKQVLIAAQSDRAVAGICSSHVIVWDLRSGREMFRANIPVSWGYHTGPREIYFRRGKLEALHSATGEIWSWLNPRMGLRFFDAPSRRLAVLAKAVFAVPRDVGLLASLE